MFEGLKVEGKNASGGVSAPSAPRSFRSARRGQKRKSDRVWEAGRDRKKSGGPSKLWVNPSKLWASKPFETPFAAPFAAQDKQDKQGKPPHSIREKWTRTIKGHGSTVVTPVKNNLLVIRMDVAGLTQWGSSRRRERVCGRGGIRKNCGNLWKNHKSSFLGAREMGQRRRNLELRTDGVA